MKRIPLLIFSILILLSLVCVSAFAQTSGEGTLLFKDDCKGYPSTTIGNSYNNDDFIAHYNYADNWENGVLYFGDCLIKANPDIIDEIYEIQDGTKWIAEGAFQNCEKLREVIIPNTVEYINDNAFAYCSNLESVSIPNNTYYLGEAAFSFCSNLKDVKIGNRVEELKENLFNSCESLNTVILGKNIKKIDKTAFQSTKFVSDPTNYQNGLLIASNKYLIKVSEDISECDIPLGVTVIADGAFEQNALTEIHIPSSLTFFNWGAFCDIVNKGIPIYYAGTFDDFMKNIDFDLSINIITKDYYGGIWIVFVLSFSFVVMLVGALLLNFKRKRKSNEKKKESENVQE